MRVKGWMCNVQKLFSNHHEEKQGNVFSKKIFNTKIELSLIEGKSS
ncbi:hypothetical protein SAMN05421839_1654 [Halolactibacillus halophilus]|uniref:Uncharacterized protein n=1 Tax=Halolactibacillus halophilus TaxID=306540 RepID=A0A1I5T733_9BACI|nr:hypothetical protein SAMN05421839_1654 [Halolactibacillus halophilus]